MFAAKMAKIIKHFGNKIGPVCKQSLSERLLSLSLSELSYTILTLVVICSFRIFEMVRHVMNNATHLI